MKDILKNLGLILIIIGVVILSIVVFRETQSNGVLATSLILVVGGLFAHIFLNKYLDK
jgi:uncharacterized protein YjeT (DUF2065 family)